MKKEKAEAKIKDTKKKQIPHPDETKAGFGMTGEG
jgi:hypothetical protein